jgi:intracellular sulfur oxidation DsrE/DsrF family protein
MKTSILTLTFLVIALTTFSQKKNKKKEEGYKIVFQLTTADTTAQKALMKQLSNITSVSPTTKIEVVCHGPGLDMLRNDKSIVAEKINLFSTKGVVFNACQFSMKERNVKQEQILESVKYVEAGILYIVDLQSKGWYYIKSGF